MEQERGSEKGNGVPILHPSSFIIHHSSFYIKKMRPPVPRLHRFSQIVFSALLLFFGSSLLSLP